MGYEPPALPKMKFQQDSKFMSCLHKDLAQTEEPKHPVQKGPIHYNRCPIRPHRDN